MFGAIKRIALAAVVVANLVLVGAPTAPAYAADTTTLTFNPATQKVQPGATFNVDVDINTLANTQGINFAINYDPTKLTLTTVTWGSFYNDYANNPANGCSSPFTLGFLPATNGVSKVGGYALIACNGPGTTGSGQLATLTFVAATGVNAATSISLSSVDVNGVNSADLTVNSGSVTIGTPLPDFTVTNATTKAVSGHPTEFTVSFQVSNIGSASAGASAA